MCVLVSFPALLVLLEGPAPTRLEDPLFACWRLNNGECLVCCSREPMYRMLQRVFSMRPLVKVGVVRFFMFSTQHKQHTRLGFFFHDFWFCSGVARGGIRITKLLCCFGRLVVLLLARPPVLLRCAQLLFLGFAGMHSLRDTTRKEQRLLF